MPEHLTRAVRSVRNGHVIESAIPTEYRQVKFRSRLEARWACMFDLLGVPWEYEPIDLQSYIPDFIIDCPLFDPSVSGFALLRQGQRNGFTTLVEVRPCLTKAEYREPIAKIARSGWRGTALVLGPIVHVSAKAFGNEFTMGFGVHEVKPHHAEPNALSWCPVGYCEDGEAAGQFAFYGTHDLRPLWREAENRVQWMPKR